MERQEWQILDRRSRPEIVLLSHPPFSDCHGAGRWGLARTVQVNPCCFLDQCALMTICLHRFIGGHFADVFRVLPESPGFGSKEEKWISLASLRGPEDSDTGTPPVPKTPERNSGLPSFALCTPSGRSPQSIRSSPSNNGSPGLLPLQFMRRADYDPFARPETPSKSPSRRPRSSLTHTPRQAWRP